MALSSRKAEAPCTCCDWRVSLPRTSFQNLPSKTFLPKTFLPKPPSQNLLPKPPSQNFLPKPPFQTSFPNFLPKPPSQNLLSKFPSKTSVPKPPSQSSPATPEPHSLSLPLPLCSPRAMSAGCELGAQAWLHFHVPGSFSSAGRALSLLCHPVPAHGAPQNHQ